MKSRGPWPADRGRGENPLRLRHALIHRRILNNNARLKTALQALVSVEVPDEESYYASLHARIMSNLTERPPSGH